MSEDGLLRSKASGHPIGWQTDRATNTHKLVVQPPRPFNYRPQLQCQFTYDINSKTIITKLPYEPSFELKRRGTDGSQSSVAISITSADESGSPSSPGAERNHLLEVTPREHRQSRIVQFFDSVLESPSEEPEQHPPSPGGRTHRQDVRNDSWYKGRDVKLVRERTGKRHYVNKLQQWEIIPLSYTELTEPPQIPSDANPAPGDRVEALPPAYPTASWASNSTTAPAYTAQPSPTERVISRTDSTSNSNQYGPRSNPRPLPDTFVNKSSRLVLDLGRRVWPSRWPVYGANATVSGKVLVRKADHGINIVVALEGLCITTLVERGMPIAQFQTTLTRQSLELWSSESGVPLRPSYDFDFPLPTYSQGGTNPLPPSCYYSVLTVGYVEVKYYVRVDMTRTRFHRHETVMSNIHYLPRSYSLPIDILDQTLDLAVPIVDDIWATTELSPVPGRLSRKHAPAPGVAKHVSIKFSLLKRPVYTPCTPIPFRLTLRSSSPALVLLPHVTIHLVKRWVLIADSFGTRIGREVVLGSGEIWRAEEIEDGRGCEKVVSGCLTGGKPEAEVSWCVEGIFRVEYLVRVSVQPPEGMRFLGDSMPTFFHQEIVRMATHEYTSDELVRGHPSLALATRPAW
ncbi:hypothetical protein FRC11_005293 [Ceratobasidium sp. 423]|nr:hypothetical protein FRC11_005293 [Ceratobasidium sp. 423]